MDTSARQRRSTNGRRLVLAGVSVAFACGFASLGAVPEVARPSPAATGSATGGGVRPDTTSVPPIAAAHPDRVVPSADPAARPLPVSDGASLASAAPAGTSLPGPLPYPERVRTFAADVGALAWKAVHGGVDGGLWHGVPSASEGVGHGRGLAGIGFPGIVGSPGEGMRVYRPLVVWRDVPDGRVPIAGVRCMGLSSAAVARRAARYEARIVELAMAEGVSASLVKAVITEESCFDPEARSPVGALGLMQLMPATATWLGVADPLDPDDNLRGGIRYLAMLEARYGDTTLALAAYNAGPGNVKRHGGVPPFAETRRYITRVTAHHRRYVAATALATR